MAETNLWYRLRVAKRISQREAAKRLSIPTTDLGDYEQGRREPEAEVRAALKALYAGEQPASAPSGWRAPRPRRR